MVLYKSDLKYLLSPTEAVRKELDTELIEVSTN